MTMDNRIILKGNNMHPIKIGDVVRSHKGRDDGYYFYVLDIKEGFVFLVDGKIRRLESPKKKNIKHVAFVPSDDTRVSSKIVAREKLLNAEIRKNLAAFYYEVDDDI